jgi:hypothetical protein
LQIAIYLIKFFLVCLLYRFPANVSLCRGSRQGIPSDDDNHVRRRDPFVKISSGVELSSSRNDFFSQILYRNILSGFNENSRTWSPRPDDYAFFNQVAASGPDVVFNRSVKFTIVHICGVKEKIKLNILCITSQTVLAFDPIVVTATGYIGPGDDLLEEIAGMEVPVSLT